MTNLPFLIVLFGISLISSSYAAALALPPATDVPPFAKLTAAAAPTTCNLRLEGVGSSPGLKAANLECSGAVLTATAAPQLLTALGPQARGIKWNPSCSSDSRCLLTICDSSVKFSSPVAQNIVLIDPGTEALICIGDNSSVIMQNGAFSDWLSETRESFVAVKVISSSAALIISNSTFFRNDLGPYGGGLMAAAGQTTVVSSSFEGCFTSQGGAIAASGQARLDIGSGATGVPTTFRLNSALRGGDMSVDGAAHVRVYGAELNSATARQEGSLLVLGNSTVELFDTTITNATAQGSRGGIGIAGNATLNMVRSTIIKCRATDAAGALSASGKSVVTLTDCTISNNMAGSKSNNAQGVPIGAAGGISAGQSARLTLQNTLVTGNAAALGGGMVINPGAQLLLQGDTTITGNEAWDRAGGINMLSDGLVGSFTDLERATRENSAPHDPDISLPIDTLLLLGTSSSTGNSTKEAFIPGDVLLMDLRIASPGGRMSDQTVTVALMTAQNVSIFTDTPRLEVVDRRRAIAKASVMIRQPPGTYWVHLKTDNNILANDTKTVAFKVRVVECPVGYATASIDSCLPCVRGYFSFNASAPECEWCPANADCQGIHSGQPQVWPEEGYWHSAPKSTQMHRCLNPKACNVSTIPTRQAADNMPVAEYKTAQCSQEYEGNLCGDCRLPSYGKVRPFVCRKCMSRPLIISLYVLAAVAMMGLIKLLLHFERRSGKMMRHALQQTPLPEELLKIMVLHGQWLYIISYLVGVPWPATLAVPLQIVTGLWSSASGSSIGFECVLKNTSRIPLGIQKELLCLLTPLAIMCVILIFEAVMHFVDPAQHAKARDKLFSLCVCVVFLFLPTWLNSVFSLFTCVKLDVKDASNPMAQAVGSWWVHDMSQLCYDCSGYHRKWAFGLGVPLVVLLCVVLPLGVFLFMWRSRRNQKLQDPAFIRHYGFMYRLWREDVCWWEAVVTLQTAGLVLVATVGFSLGPYRQSLVTCAVLGCVIVMLLWVRPFACRAANHIAVASACVLFVTAYSALSFLPYEGDAPSSGYTMAMGVVILLANVIFLVVACYKLVQAVDWSTVNNKLLATISQISGGKLFIRPGSATNSQLAGGQSGECRSIPAAPGKDLGSGRMAGPPKEYVV